MWICSFFVDLPLLEGAEYPYSFRSAYFRGRGDTGIAIAEDGDAVLFNPAGLALAPHLYNKIILASPSLEFSRDTRDVVKQIAIQNEDPTDILKEHIGKAQHFRFGEFTGILLRKVAIGAYVDQSMTVLLYKDPTLGALETVDASAKLDLAATFSLADCWSKQSFCLGLTSKFIRRTQGAIKANAAEASQLKDLSGDSLAMTGSGVGVNLGAMYRWTEQKVPFHMGFTIEDVAGTNFTPEKPTTLVKSERPLKDIKQTLNLGLALIPGTQFSRIKLLFDYKDLLNVYKQETGKHVHLGGELSILNFIGFTFGLNQGYPSVGFYTDLRFLRVDLGFYSEELGDALGERSDERYFVGLRIAL